jgi:Protein of unknown function (DUF2630)
MAFAVNPSPATATASTTRNARVTEDPDCRAPATRSSLGRHARGGHNRSERMGRMDDSEIHRHIDELVGEEHRLERAHVGQGLSAVEQARLDAIGVQLDRYWDLLRQRDARRRVGLDPDTAQPRSADVVEGYRQ